MEMRREADSNDITESSQDDKPSVGMFVVFLMLYSLQSCVWFSCFLVVLICSLYVLHQHITLTAVTDVSFDSNGSYFCAFVLLSCPKWAEERRCHFSDSVDFKDVFHNCMNLVEFLSLHGICLPI